MAELINPYFTFIAWQPDAVIACKCKQPQVLVMQLWGFNEPKRCRFCGTDYRIAGVAPDGTLVIDVHPASAQSEFKM